jgi:hypothetical protein
MQHPAASALCPGPTDPSENLSKGQAALQRATEDIRSTDAIYKSQDFITISQGSAGTAFAKTVHLSTSKVQLQGYFSTSAVLV